VYIKSAGATGVGCKIETAATAAPGAALYVLCSGVGNAYGINVAGGSTGTGLYITGQYGVAILASNGDGINSTSQAGGNGMSLVGQSNTRGADDNLGHGLYVQGLVAGDGLHATALPSGSGNGIFGAAGTNAVGMYLTAQYGLYCLSSGANGNGIYALGNGSGYGVYSSGGATGSGMGLMGGGGNANGLITNGQGSGSGIIAQCGGTGHGITAQSATGASILCVASAGALAGIQGDLGGRILGNTTTAFAGIGAQVDVEQWSGGAVPTLPTAAATATAVWQDLMAGADFGTAGSIGALLKADINAPIGSIPTNPLLASSAPANFTLLAIDSSGRMTVSPTGLDNVLIGTRKLTNYIKWSFCTTAGALPSGAGSGQENYKDADGNPGVDATIDTNGNRTAIVLH